MPSPPAPITFDCTGCGARLSVDGATRVVRCIYCRAEAVLPEAIWLQFHPAPRPTPPFPTVPSVPRAPLVIAIAVAVVMAIVGAVVAVVGAVAGGTRAFPIPTASPSPNPNPIATSADACNGRSAACASDGKAELVCGPDGRMVVGETCKGPNGCRAAIDGKTIRCDVTLADPHDPCSGTDDACSTDHKAELRCEAGHFAVLATCKGPDGCTLTPARSGSGYTLSCDDHVADVGDPCFDAQRTACSSDKRALLTCTAQRFVVDHACKSGCSVKKLVGTGDVEMSCR